MANKQEIGNDAVLMVGGESYPITSVSYSEEGDISSVHFNDGLNPDKVLTSVDYSGSFEHSGGNEDLRDALYQQVDGAGGQTEVPRSDVLIKVTDDTHEYYFYDCIVEGRDKDFPADDRTEVSYDFVAGRMLTK